MKDMRRLFFNLNDFVEKIDPYVKEAHSILDVGCGRGELVRRLKEKYPDKLILGMDKFYGQSIYNCSPNSYDLVILCDVLHHVAPREHDKFISHLKAIGKRLIVKEWAFDHTPITYLAILVDLVMAGRVKLYTEKELEKMFGKKQFEVKPRKNNVGYILEY